jgi:iron complex transport system permease protein
VGPAESGARRRAIMAALAAALLASMVLAVLIGAVPITLSDVASALGNALSGVPTSPSDFIIVDVRIPRVILAALVGACLAGAGVIYQAIFRNPLADPYILGVSSGAGLGAMLAIVLTAQLTILRYGVVPLAAFAGALLTMLLVVRLATLRGRLEAASLLLAGVALSYTLAAITAFVMVLASEQMSAIVYWMMGGLTGASWLYVAMIALMLIAGITVPMLARRQLKVMLLGDERAEELGLPVERFTILMLAAASLLTAAAVSVAGLIGFVGLMVPHIVRLMIGPDHRLLLPASLLTGGIVLVLSDLLARTIIAPVEIPVGIVTAILGGPFFIYLLVRGERAL